MGWLEVQFRSAPGIADSDWMRIAPGVAVLTGRNNVGKSRVLVEISRLPSYMGGPAQATPVVRLEDDNVGLTVDMRGSPAPARYDLTRSGQPVVVRVERTEQNQSRVVVEEPGRAAEASYYNSIPASVNAIGLPERDRLSRVLSRLIYLPPQRLIPATVPTAPVEVPAAQGSDLGQAIYKHRNALTQQFAEFEATVADMFPEVAAVLTDPVDQQRVTIKLRDKYAKLDVPLDQAGTGVAQLLHLIATILFLPIGRILLVDEPQLHLHPGAEKLLAAFIRRHSEHDYVFATHSAVFINAVKPDRAWLLLRDESGTHIHTAFDERLTRGQVLTELGLSTGDIVLAERILLVEGAADLEIYPRLLMKCGWDPVRLNCSVLQLHGADTARPLREVVDELSRLLNMRLLIVLDGDKRDQVAQSDVIRVLPVPDVESIFLRDPAAVAAGFNDVLEQEHPNGFDLPVWRTEWPAGRIEAFITERRSEKPERKGAGILADLAEAMGHLVYRKPVHGPRIAERISGEALSDLAALLQPLMD